MTVSASYPLLPRHDPRSTVAVRHGRPISCAEFLADVAYVAAAMPAGRHVLNTCADRYCFAVGFAATLTSGRISLLPSTLTDETVGALKVFAADAFHLTDGDPDALDLPALMFPDRADRPLAPLSMPVPVIASDALVAWVFTS